MNKPNDIVQTFGNPIKCVCPIGQAKLIEKLSDHTPLLENWKVEYLDTPDHFYTCLIKKTNGESK